jgi:hypothetical protein
MERAFGGAFIRVRAELGISAFGVQVVELPPNSGERRSRDLRLPDGVERDGPRWATADAQHLTRALDAAGRCRAC